MAIKIDDRNVFQPDASVTWGEDVDDALILTAPIIVVELLSPSTAARAVGAKRGTTSGSQASATS